MLLLSEEHRDVLVKYLLSKPMLEVEPGVYILRTLMTAEEPKEVKKEVDEPETVEKV